MSLFRSPPFRTGWKRGEKRAEEYVAQEYLDKVLAGFSGYIAADELYDGPYCVLSIVDNHNFQRLLYEVLDHDPTEGDITRFFQRFQDALTTRGLTLRGITTDGSALYPTPIGKVFGSSVAHQICQFHILAELARLRQRVARFQHLHQTLKKLFSPNLEKALTFLDDSLLPATSNAVERGNRRHRKMQKAVYRVRTQQTIRRRIALDMQRDLQASARHQTTATLHQQRREMG